MLRRDVGEARLAGAAPVRLSFLDSQVLSAAHLIVINGQAADADGRTIPSAYVHLETAFSSSR